MTADGSISDSAQPAPASRKRVALRWWFWGVISAPPTVLVHELGHFLVYWGLGFPGAVLRYGSASAGDGASVAPVWQATALAMGLAVTYVVVFACCYLCLSNFRITAALGVLVLPIFGVRIEAGCDECKLEGITGIPLAV